MNECRQEPADEQGNLLGDRLLAILFVAGEPVPFDRLEAWLGIGREGLARLLDHLGTRLVGLPWRIRLAAGGARLGLDA